MPTSAPNIAANRGRLTRGHDARGARARKPRATQLSCAGGTRRRRRPEHGGERSKASPGPAALWRPALVLVAIGGLAFGLFKYSGLSVREVHDVVAGWGNWGPIAWTACLWLLLPLMAPVSVMTALSGLAFGPWIGFASAYVGVVGGGWLIFWISRLAGRRWVERLLGEHASRLNPHIDAHGLFGTLYLRMLPLPYVPVSYLAGLTRIDFGPYALGTALGIVPGVLVNSVVAGTVGEVWLTDQGWGALFQPRTFWAGIVVVLSLVAPFGIEGVRRWLSAAEEVKGGTNTQDPPQESP